MNFQRQRSISFSMVALVAIQLVTLSQAHAGKKTFIDADSAADGEINYLLNGERVVPAADPEGYDPFTKVKTGKGKGNILFLGDGFDNPNWVPLAEAVQGRVDGATKIWKTGFDCPAERDDVTVDNLTTKKVDHTKPLDFANNQFDTLVMRRGLCHCDGTQTTCGGITLGKKDDKRGLKFFYEIARVMNKKNPNAIAFLHGTHHSAFTGESPVIEGQSEADIEKIMGLVETAYPAVGVEMVYVNHPVQAIISSRVQSALGTMMYSAQSTGDFMGMMGVMRAMGEYQRSGDYSKLIDVSDLKDKDTGLLKAKIPVFQGVKMSVKSAIAD